jgi:class 3 adenylate cyclase
VTSAQIRPLSGEPSLDAIEVLQGVPDELRAKWRRQQYEDGKLVVASGADADRLIILVRGYLAIKDGDTRIATRAPVRLIGELAFIDDKPRSASVFADGAVVTYELAGADVPELMADAAFRRNLNVELSWKLREATSERAWRFAQHEVLFGTVGSFVSRELLQDLLAKRDDGTPRQADAVTLFADIENFTGKTLSMTPTELNRDLSAFLDLAVEVVLEHRGMVDKFIGDEVMAIWGYAPNPDDAANAFLAAEDLVRRAAALTLDGEPLRIGVGVESGLVTLGVYGNESKKQFTAIGSSVNLAARLQALSRNVQQPICVGPDLAERLPAELLAKLVGPTRHDLHHIGPTNVWTFDPNKE